MSEITTMTTTEHRRQYADDGVTLVRAAFDPAWIDRLRAASDRAMSQRGELTREYDTNEGGRFHATTFLWLSDPDVEAFDLEPGDVVAHHVMTLHGAPGNTHSGARRRGLSTRWCGDDAVYDPRDKTMPLPFDPGIAAGAPMRADRLPLIFTRDLAGPPRPPGSARAAQ